MAEIASFPGFTTRRPWEGGPVAPFHWRPVNMGATAFEFLCDAHGQQVFHRSSAILRKAGTTVIIWPELSTEDETGGANG